MSARLLRGAAMVAALVPLALAMLPAPAQGQAWKPSFTWSSYLGGGQVDELRDAVTNANDDVFVVGQSNSTSGFPADAGLPKSGSAKDAVVARFNQDGSLAWTRVFGGSGDDLARRVRLAGDGSGDVFVVGTLSQSAGGIQDSSTTTLTPAAAQLYKGGSSDAFLARVGENGELRWFIFLGGDNTDEGIALVVDETTVYVGGRSKSSSSSFSAPAKSGIRGDGFDAFVTQVDVSVDYSPNPVWTRFIGTDDDNDIPFESIADDAAYALVAKAGAIYVAGSVGSRLSDIDKSIKTVEEFHLGSDDGFVAKLTGSGGVEWFTNVGSSSTDEVRDLLTVPGKEELIAVGRTNSSSFLTSDFSGSGHDTFVLRVKEDGTLGSGGIRVGGGGDEEVAQAAVDSLGNVFFGGRTLSSSGLARNAFDNTYSGSSDGFATMLDADLTRPVWASYVGGASSAEEWVRAVATGPLGRLTLVGSSDATAVLQGPAGHDSSNNGGLDGILFRLEVDPSAPSVGQVVASISETGVFATWGFSDSSKNFSDPETGISRYEWAIGHSGESDNVQPFTPVVATTTEASAIFPPEAGLTYYVTVRAFNGVGRPSTDVRSTGLLLSSPDAGTGNIPDPVTPSEPDEDEAPVDPLSPLGFGCGSTGGGSLVGALGLVALALLMARRARRAAGLVR